MPIFTTATNQILNIGDDAASHLDELIDKFDLEILDDVLEYLIKDTASARLNKIGKTKLEEIRNILAPIVEKIPGGEYLEALAAPVAKIPSEGIKWGWADDAKPSIPDVGNLTISLGVTAEASATIFPGPKYEFGGKAGISSSLKAPFAYGAFSAKGSAAGSIRLVSAFNHSNQTRTVAALANDLAVIANMTDPSRLLDQHFEELQLGLDGTVNLGGELTAGKSWTTQLSKKGSTVLAAEAKAGLTYKVDWARHGNFVITIKKNGALLKVNLTELHEESKSRSLSIGANVKFSGVRETLQPTLDRIAGLPKPLEKIVGNYSRPSDLFTDALNEYFSSHSDRVKAIVSVISGQSSAETLIDNLSDEAINFVDGRARRWTDVVNGEIGSFVLPIVEQLNIPSSVLSDVESLLEGALENASDAVIQELNKELQAVVKGSARKEIVTFLDSIGDETASLLDASNAIAEQVFDPVKDLLKRYRSFEESLIDAVEVVEKEQLAFQFVRSVEDKKEKTKLLEFEIDPSKNGADTIFREMLIGNFKNAMIAGMAGKFGITLTKGHIKNVLESKESTNIQINFLGTKMDYSRLLATKLTVRNSVGGSIDIFEASGSITVASAAFGETEEALISSSLNLAGTAKDSDSPALVVRIKHTDENLTIQELRDFVGSFANAGLLAKGANDRISDSSSTLGVIDEDGDRNLALSAQLSLTRREVEKLTKLSNSKVKSTSIREQLDALDDTPVNRDYLANILPSNVFLDPDDHKFFTQSHSDIVRDLDKLGSNAHPNQLRYSAYLIERIGDNAEGLVGFLNDWEELVAMPLPKPDAQLEIPADELKTFDDKNKDMIEFLDNWPRITGPIRKALKEEFVSPWTLAFFKTLLSLAGREDELLPVYVSWKEKERMKRIVLV